MNDRPEPERIEIELTSNAERRDRRHPWDSDDSAPDAQPDSIVAEPSDESSESTGSDQRRTFIAAAIVGLLALVLGWLIGRAGDTGDVATSDVTAPVTTESTRTPLLTGETLPTAATTTTRPRRTTTTRPRRTTTTTTLAAPALEIVEIDPRLAGIELTLVGVDGRQLLELDLGAQTLLRRDFGRVDEEVESIVVGSDWIAIPEPWNGWTRVIHDDGTIESIDLGEPWRPLWREDTDRFWREEGGGWNGPSRFVEVDLAGEPTGVVLDLPPGTSSWVADPNGGLIVTVAGKNYSVDEDSIEIIGAGDLIALSYDVAVTTDCDERLRCGLVVTDRSTGDAIQIEIDESFDGVSRFASLYGWAGPEPGTISPDGTMCAVVLLSDSEPVAGLIDFELGVFVELGRGVFLPGMTWSPDSRFAFFLDGFNGFGGSDLRVYDRVSGDVFPVLSSRVDWRVLEARPGPP